MTDRTDNFNRANGSLGANWTTRTDANNTGSLVISGNKVVVNAINEDSLAYWSADTFANDQYSEAVFTSEGLVGVRCTTSGTLKYYEYGVTTGSGSFIEIYDGTTWSTLAGGGSVTNGSLVRCEITGTSLTAKVAGSTTITATDATIASGSPFLHLYDSGGTHALDDWLGGPISGATNKTLDATTAGTYTLTGTAATLKVARKNVAAAGSYSMTGTAATLIKGHPIAAGAGAYTFTGQAATLKHAWRLTAAAGAYTMTGTAASVLHNWKLAAAAGAYTFTGQAATTRKGYPLVAGVGAYALTGAAATLRHAWMLAAGAGSYALSGQAATLLHAWRLAAAAGAYALNGAAASLLHSWRLTAAAGAYNMTGTAATLTKLSGKTVTADPGTYAMTGQAVNLLENKKLAAAAGAYALTGQAATLRKGYVHTAGAGAYTFTGTAATTLANKKLAAAAGAYNLSGQSVNLNYSGAVAPPVITPPVASGGGGYVSTHFYSKPTPAWLILWQRIQWLLKGLDGQTVARLERVLRAALEGWAEYPASSVNVAALALLSAVEVKTKSGRPISSDQATQRIALQRLVDALAEDESEEAEIQRLVTDHHTKTVASYETIKSQYQSLKQTRASIEAEIAALEGPEPDERVASQITALENTIASATSLLTELRNLKG